MNQTTNQIIIRKETKEDYYNTEHMVMRAFWNIHGPGCNEHYLVHVLRQAPEYLPELSRVAELDGRIVGAIFYSAAKVVEDGKEHEVLTFGPLAVEPTCFNMGIASKLLKTTMALAEEAGYSGIVICGEPEYYPKHGFVTCDHFGIKHPTLGNFDAFMACQLNSAFEAVHGTLYESRAFEACEDEERVQEYTKRFPYYKPLKLSCQWLHKERLGRISAVRKNSFMIRFFEMEIPAKLKGGFYEKEDEVFPVVGDYVTFLYNPMGDSVILSVCERTSLLQRPDQSKTGVMQYMLANVEDGIDNTFSDIRELESRCRFSNCRHDTEPGCAVKAAIEEGTLSRKRLLLYQNLGKENTRNYARKKEISKQRRAYRKNQAE